MLKYFMRLWNESKLEAQKNFEAKNNRCRHNIKNSDYYSDEYLQCVGIKGHTGLHSGRYTYDGLGHIVNWKDNDSCLQEGRYDY